MKQIAYKMFSAASNWNL